MGNTPTNLPSEFSTQSSSSSRQPESAQIFQGQGHTVGGGSTIPENNREALREAFLKHFEETSQQTAVNEIESHPGIEKAALETNELESLTPQIVKSISELQQATTMKSSEFIFNTATGSQQSKVGTFDTSDVVGVDEAKGSMCSSEIEGTLSSEATSINATSDLVRSQIREKENTLMEAIFACSLGPNETTLNQMVVSNPSLYRSGVVLYLESLSKEMRAELLNPSDK